MGSYGCPCGHGFKDYTPDQAQLISMQDWEDFMEVSQASKLNLAWHFVKATLYQCPSCLRLHVHMRKGFDHSAGTSDHTFTPDHKDSAELLRSVQGRRWKRVLHGTWSDPNKQGYVHWGSPGYPGRDDDQGDHGSVTLNSWAEIESLYHDVYQRLVDAKKLGVATLQRNGELVHSWSSRPFWREA